VAASRSEIEGLADEAIAQVSGEMEFDFHQMVSRRIPGNTICHLMGIPTDDREMLLGLTDEISDAVSPSISDDALHRADQAAEALSTYIIDLADRRRVDRRRIRRGKAQLRRIRRNHTYADRGGH
jgi:cytochrome P450